MWSRPRVGPPGQGRAALAAGLLLPAAACQDWEDYFYDTLLHGLGPSGDEVVDTITLWEGIRNGLHSDKVIGPGNVAPGVWGAVGQRMKPNLPFLERLPKAPAVRGDSRP